MSRVKFLWLRAIAAIGLQWRKVTVCIYGPVECRLERRASSSGVGNTSGSYRLGPQTRQAEGPRGPERRKAVGNVGKPSETKRREAVRNITKPSETSGRRRKAVGNVGKPSETKRREAVRNITKPSETSGRRREAVGNVGKPSETSGSRRKAVGQFSETAECQHPGSSSS